MPPLCYQLSLTFPVIPTTLYLGCQHRKVNLSSRYVKQFVVAEFSLSLFSAGLTILILTYLLFILHGLERGLP